MLPLCVCSNIEYKENLFCFVQCLTSTWLFKNNEFYLVSKRYGSTANLESSEKRQSQVSPSSPVYKKDLQ